jgi:hypothetical protein
MAEIVNLKRIAQSQRSQPAFYSVKGLSKELGVSPRQVRTAISLGQIKTVEFGHHPVIPIVEVIRLKKLFGLN